jgi:phospholipid-binding lipoprotein MlaA
MGDAANQAIYAFNAWLFSSWNALVPSGPPSPTSAAIGSAVSNLFLNWINEPITVVSYTLAGRFDHAGIAGRRFLVNTFRGWGGVLDPATELGIVVPRTDLGLALCALGTPTGPYTVLPIVGPRTLRDGLADLVAVNGIVYLALVPLGLSTGTIVIILVADEVVHLALMRQIDAVAAGETAARGFEDVRAEYLADRDARCAQLRNGRHRSLS